MMSTGHTNPIVRTTRRWITGTMVAAAFGAGAIGVHLADSGPSPATDDTAVDDAGLVSGRPSPVMWDDQRWDDDDEWENDDDDSDERVWTGFQRTSPLTSTSRPAATSTRAS